MFAVRRRAFCDPPGTVVDGDGQRPSSGSRWCGRGSVACAVSASRDEGVAVRGLGYGSGHAGWGADADARDCAGGQCGACDSGIVDETPFRRPVDNHQTTRH